MTSAASILRTQIEATLANRIPGALTPRPRIVPETISNGIAELNAKSIGIPRGSLTEICGPPSSGRTTLLLSLMRHVTQNGECCALIDTSNAFDPLSAAANGVFLKRLLWAKCAQRHGKLSAPDKALKATDIIINGGGFGLIVLDLADVEPHLARKIPLTSWYRFSRAVESTSTAFVVLEQQSCAKSCASLVITLRRGVSEWMPTLSQSQNPKLLTGASLEAGITRSRLEVIKERKPPGHAVISFRAATPWAG